MASNEHANLCLPFRIQVHRLDVPLLHQLYRWCFSEEEMQRAVQNPAEFPPTGLRAQVNLQQAPYFKGGNAMLAGKAGWLAMQAMIVKTQPKSAYLLAAAVTFCMERVASRFHIEQTDPFMLAGLFPSATRLESSEQPVPKDVQLRTGEHFGGSSEGFTR